MLPQEMLGFFLVICFFGATGIDARPGSFYFPSYERSPFIVGGKTCKKGEWPHQLSLQTFDFFTGWDHTCGAVLIGEDKALTAAHCVHNRGKATSFRVLTGCSDLYNMDQEEIIVLKDMSVHQNYSSGNGSPNDMAVLTLSKPATMGQYVKAVALPEPHEDFLAHDCYITGWGKTSGEDLDASYILRQADIDVITNDNCKTRMKDVDMDLSGSILETHICVTDVASASKGSCQGDSGGPLNCRYNSTSSYKVAGITSWGVGSFWDTCQTKYPSVYVRVSKFLEWISER